MPLSETGSCRGSVEATLTTMTCSASIAARNSVRSCFSRRRIAGTGSSRGMAASASEAIFGPALCTVPGRIRPSISVNVSRQRATISGVVACISVATRMASCSSETWRISWPPTISSSQAGRSRPRNWGSWVTRPVASMRPCRSAVRPTIAVVATPPFAPISQTPMRRFVMMEGSHSPLLTLGALLRAGSPSFFSPLALRFRPAESTCRNSAERSSYGHSDGGPSQYW